MIPEGLVDEAQSITAPVPLTAYDWKIPSPTYVHRRGCLNTEKMPHQDFIKRRSLQTPSSALSPQRYKVYLYLGR